jgi:hypothetical protein
MGVAGHARARAWRAAAGGEPAAARGRARAGLPRHRPGRRAAARAARWPAPPPMPRRAAPGARARHQGAVARARAQRRTGRRQRGGGGSRQGGRPPCPGSCTTRVGKKQSKDSPERWPLSSRVMRARTVVKKAIPFAPAPRGGRAPGREERGRRGHWGEGARRGRPRGGPGPDRTCRGPVQTPGGPGRACAGGGGRRGACWAPQAAVPAARPGRARRPTHTGPRPGHTVPGGCPRGAPARRAPSAPAPRHPASSALSHPAYRVHPSVHPAGAAGRAPPAPPARRPGALAARARAAAGRAAARAARVLAAGRRTGRPASGARRDSSPPAPLRAHTSSRFLRATSPYQLALILGVRSSVCRSTWTRPNFFAQPCAHSKLSMSDLRGARGGGSAGPV